MLRLMVTGFRNIVLLLKFTIPVIIAGFIPERFWTGISRRLASWILCLPRARQRAVRRFERVFGDHFNRRERMELAIRRKAAFFESRIQGLRLYHPLGWQPKIKFMGKEHIDSALAKKKGVMLWLSPFSFTDLIAKMALYQQGYRVSHLSRPTHGIDHSSFGIKFLNPIWHEIENRYLKSRVVLPLKGSSSTALKTLNKCLANNEIVSITVGGNARKSTEYSFLSAKLWLATAPAHISETSGAPLLPVFTVRGEAGVYEVVVGAKLNSGESIGPEKGTQQIGNEYIKRLEPYVLKYPAQWQGEPD